MTCAVMAWLPVLSLSLLLLCVRDSVSLFLPDSKELRQLLSRYEEEIDQNSNSNTTGNRNRRAIRWSDREEIVLLHNKLRGSVYPTASNMENMVRHVPLTTLPSYYLLSSNHSQSTKTINNFNLWLYLTKKYILMCQQH